ncbi:MAG: high-potential iron-sulfur protein [Pseudomonadota bacterium]|nr:high-potential iron-sulfur protein [Pseudomonadota bacterium]
MVDRNRRAALRGLVGVGIAAVAARTAVAQDQKLPQATVQYQDMPKDGNECDKCVNWVAPNQCTIVTGNISPKGWCVAYAPKEG